MQDRQRMRCTQSLFYAEERSISSPRAQRYAPETFLYSSMDIL